MVVVVAGSSRDGGDSFVEEKTENIWMVRLVGRCGCIVEG